MKSLGIASFSLLQLLLLSNSCSAETTSENPNPLARMLLARFASSSASKHLLRRLAGDEEITPMKKEFGPGSDWSCTAESNQATDFDSCTLSEASKTVEGGCSWCPLGSETGFCVRAGQASVINSFENDRLLHLKCYSDSEDVIDEDATAFWDEAMACLPHHRETCGGDHTYGDHKCTYCSTKEPYMGLCLSVELWDNLMVAQALEEFEWSVPLKGDQIQLEQVIHCSEDTTDEEKDDEFVFDDSIWDNPCEGPPITDNESEEDCFTKEGCGIAPNIFPGFLGSKSGKRCVSVAQVRATRWAVDLLEDMGWNQEMEVYKEQH